MTEPMMGQMKPGISGMGNYAEVNGLNMYYEIYGEPGEGSVPLILIHGGLGTTGDFGALLPFLAQDRQVIAAEMQGHGHTADAPRPLTFEGMADDVHALVKRLGLDRADLMGYSLGGGVALQAAIRHPEIVHKLVVISAPCKRQGWYPEVLAGMAAMDADAAQRMVGSPMQQAYASAAPQPENWPVLATKTSELLKQEYDWSSQVAAIGAPVMIAAGDADSVRTAHLVEMFALLDGGKQDGGWDGSGRSKSRLLVMPATTHFTIISSPALAVFINEFLSAPHADVR